LVGPWWFSGFTDVLDAEETIFIDEDAELEFLTCLDIDAAEFGRNEDCEVEGFRHAFLGDGEGEEAGAVRGVAELFGDGAGDDVFIPAEADVVLLVLGGREFVSGEAFLLGLGEIPEAAGGSGEESEGTDEVGRLETGAAAWHGKREASWPENKIP
jgi:hypothetical protein